MMQRCYTPSFPKYKYYGGSGVTVCEEWQTLSGFIETVDTVDGWNEVDFLASKLQLDKDTKIVGNKIYSPTTCKFIDPNLNRFEANKKHMKPSVAVDPEGNRYEFLNRKAFCDAHGLDDVTVYRCLIGERNHHKLWTFYYLDGTTPERSRSNLDLKYAISPDGLYYEFRSTGQFGREHNLQHSGIQSVVRGDAKTYKKRKFGYK